MRLLFSVTIKDCDTHTFSVGGHGGAGKDTSNSGVRIVHRASGAVGECRETRSMQKNRTIAFERMAKTKKFKAWHKLETARRSGQPSIEELVDKSLAPQNLKFEIKNEKGQWYETNIE